MSKFLKKSLALIPRTGHWVNYRKNYLTMERNERVDEFSKTIIKESFGGQGQGLRSGAGRGAWGEGQQ